MAIKDSKLTEQIQDGHALANEVMQVVKDGLDKLKGKETAIACFDDEFRMQFDTLMDKRNGKVH